MTVMRQLVLLTALNAGTFGSDLLEPKFRVQTELAPAASFISMSGNPALVYLTTTTAAGANKTSVEQEINFLGGIGRQSFRYGEWLGLDASIAFGLSVGGAGLAHQAGAPTRSTFFDALGELYFSLSLYGSDRVRIEPALGFGYLWLDVQDMRDGGLYGRMNEVEEISAYGPTAGLYARLRITDEFSMRLGSAYQITQMQLDAFDGYGVFVGKTHFRARRHGFLSRLRFDYRASDFMTFMIGVEMQSWASSGTTIYYRPTPVCMCINRTRLSWGVNFNY